MWTSRWWKMRSALHAWNYPLSTTHHSGHIQPKGYLLHRGIKTPKEQNYFWARVYDKNIWRWLQAVIQRKWGFQPGTAADLSILISETGKLEGGSDCQSERDGNKWCYVSKFLENVKKYSFNLTHNNTSSWTIDPFQLRCYYCWRMQCNK